MASLVIFSLCAGCALLPGERLPRWAILGPALGYLGSVTLLLIAGGTNPTTQSSIGGLLALVLLPVLAMALYYPASYSAIVIAASMVSLTIADTEMRSTLVGGALRVMLWTAVTVVVTVTIHRLRRNLEGEARDSAEQARVGGLISGAARSLTSLRDPREVIAESVRVMAELAGAEVTRISYARVRDGVVSEDVMVDDLSSVPTGWLERDDPSLGQAMASSLPLVTTLERTAMGPTLRSVVDETGLAHVALLPVAPEGRLHGVMVIGSRRVPISDGTFSRCRAFVNVVELALANALVHRELETQAHSDPLTGLANRRGLAQYLDGECRGRAVAVLVLDVDGMKVINDVHGHDIGDAALVAVARVAASRLRECDLLARTGGDEFVAVLRDADDADARRVVLRLQRAISGIAERGVPASVSIGYACCLPYGDIERAIRQADDAMYEAKHRGHRHPRERRVGARISRETSSTIRRQNSGENEVTTRTLG